NFLDYITNGYLQKKYQQKLVWEHLKMKINYIIKKTRFFLTFSAFKRGKLLRSYGDMKYCGNNIFFQPRKYPGDPELLKFKDNVVVASDVTFISHDVMHHMFNNLDSNSTAYHMAPIEVGNNVFIGSRSIILPGVRIEDNCI